MATKSTAIRRVESFVLEQPVTVPTGPSVATYSSRSSVIVRIEDGSGRVGWGETYRRAGVGPAIDELGATLIDRDPQSARHLVEQLANLGSDRLAVSALAIAIDDLRARQLEVSVASLYGGPRRTSVQAYASSGGYQQGVNPEVSWMQEVQSAVRDGYSACKLRIGRFPMSREIPLLERVRAEVGIDFDLIVDANGAYSVPTAIAVGRQLEKLAIRWFEEPLIRLRGGLIYPGYQHLGVLDIPIAAGEGLSSRGEFHAFIARNCAAIVQPDVAICGGIGEALFVAELAALDGRLCIPHSWGGAILLAATVQLMSLLPEPSELVGLGSLLLEFDRFENRMRTEMTVEPIQPVGGVVAVPTGPGLGISVNEDFVRDVARSQLVVAG